jgi:DNA repair protein RecO (recombination protein O)
VIGSDRGLVLRTYKLRETSQIVSLLGHEHGRLRLVANGGRGGRHRFGAALEVGNEIDVVFSLPAGRELGTLREAGLRRGWLGGMTRLDRLGTGLAVIEILDRVVPEGARDAGLLAAAIAALESVRASDDRGAAVMAFLRFELALLGQLGLQPALAGCGGCGAAPGTSGAWLDLRAGALECRDCGGAGSGRMRLSPDVAAALADLAAAQPGMVPSAPVRRALGLALHRLLATHVERYQYPRSLRLLKKVDKHAVAAPLPQPFSRRVETA